LSAGLQSEILKGRLEIGDFVSGILNVAHEYCCDAGAVSPDVESSGFAGRWLAPNPARD